MLAIRDTGCQAAAIVHSDLVNPSDYTGDMMQCIGAFDDMSRSYRVPITNVNLVAPALNGRKPIRVSVGVWPLSGGVKCLVGNAWFPMNPQLRDVVGFKAKQNKAGKLSQIESQPQVSLTANENGRGANEFGVKLHNL